VDYLKINSFHKLFQIGTTSFLPNSEVNTKTCAVEGDGKSIPCCNNRQQYNCEKHPITTNTEEPISMKGRTAFMLD